MAKNVIRKKKRITHMMTGAPGLKDAGDSLDSSFDIFSVIQEMDSCSSVNMKTCSDLFKNKNTRRLNKLNDNNTQIPTATSTCSNSQAEKKAALKFKKFSTTRKFPLMEKTQKTLKQLKHNRSIPKPRAHVASATDLLLTKSDAKIETVQLSLSDKKQPNMQKDKSVRKKEPAVVKPLKKITAPSQCKNPLLNDINQKSMKSLETDKKSNRKQNEVENKKVELKSNNLPSSKNTTNEHLDSGATTDSEYERFIKSNKVELEEVPRKAKKKTVKKKRKVVKRKSKPLKKNCSTESIPEQCNSNSYYNSSEEDNFLSCSKRVTRAQSNALITDAPESTQNLNDEDSRISLKTLRKKRNIRKTRSQRKCSSTDSNTDQYDSNFHDDSSNEDSYGGFTETTKDNENAVVTDTPVNFVVFEHLNDENSRISLKSLDNFEIAFQEDDSIGTQMNSFSENKVILSGEPSKIKLPEKNLEVAYNHNSDISLERNSIYTQSFTPKTNIKEDTITKSLDENLQKTENADGELIYCGLPNPFNTGVLQFGNLKQKAEQVPAKDAEMIDLCSSDSETENTETTNIFSSSALEHKISDEHKILQDPALITPGPEEPDIEILDVVLAYNKKQVPDCKNYENPSVINANEQKIKDVLNSNHQGSNITHSLTSAITSVKNIAEKVIKPVALDSVVADSSQSMIDFFNVKKEVVEKSEKKELVERNNPVYMTNICEKYVKTGVSHNRNDALITNSVSSSSNLTNQHQNNKVYDDDIIIIESDAKGQSQTIDKIVKLEREENDDIVEIVSIKKEPSVENILISPNQHSNCKRKIESYSDSNIKIETAASCSKLPKIVNVQSTLQENILAKNKSDSSGTQSVIENALSKDSQNATLESLLNIFKKEFQTCQELINTEANLEASLKFIEQQQAEKLNNIRSVIQNLIKNNQVSADSVLSNISSGNKVQISSQAKLSFQDCQEAASGNLLGHITSSAPILSVKPEKDVKPGISCLNLLPASVAVQSVQVKSEPCENTQVLGFFGKKCDVCGKEAVAACQRCAKAFFCSNECGKQFWNSGHENVCSK